MKIVKITNQLLYIIIIRPQMLMTKNSYLNMQIYAKKKMGL